MEMMHGPRAVAGGKLVGRRDGAGKIGFCGGYGVAKL